MNYAQALKNLNRSISKRKPTTFNQSWVRNCVRKSYDFIVQNIMTESGDTDWDKVVSNLDHDYQKLWMKGVRRNKKVVLYKDASEVDAILTKYKKKLYTFLAQADKEDKKTCNEICIRLVRTAQKGNLLAKERALNYIKQLVSCWIDTEYFKHWCGYDDLLETNIDRCIRCYRYSGSFIVYLRRTLEYSGRGIRSIEAYSLDEQDSLTDRKKSDNLVYDEITGETRLYHQK